jgi:hypothetical protein
LEEAVKIPITIPNLKKLELLASPSHKNPHDMSSFSRLSARSPLSDTVEVMVHPFYTTTVHGMEIATTSQPYYFYPELKLNTKLSMQSQMKDHIVALASKALQSNNSTLLLHTIDMYEEFQKIQHLDPNKSYVFILPKQESGFLLFNNTAQILEGLLKHQQDNIFWTESLSSRSGFLSQEDQSSLQGNGQRLLYFSGESVARCANHAATGLKGVRLDAIGLSIDLQEIMLDYGVKQLGDKLLNNLKHLSQPLSFSSFEIFYQEHGALIHKYHEETKSIFKEYKR